jgi:hypothetical protein
MPTCWLVMMCLQQWALHNHAGGDPNEQLLFHGSAPATLSLIAREPLLPVPDLLLLKDENSTGSLCQTP